MMMDADDDEAFQDQVEDWAGRSDLITIDRLHTRKFKPYIYRLRLTSERKLQLPHQPPTHRPQIASSESEKRNFSN